MRGRVVPLRSLVSCLALSATSLSCETASAEQFVEYLHVEAGSGASGGGHAAMRIGDTTYHYVYDDPGIIEASAEPNEQFDYAYRALGNRSIHVSRIAVSDATYDALADAFERRHITEQAQLERLDTAADDGALVAYLAERVCAAGDGSARSAAPRLRGSGYFASASRSTIEALSNATASDATTLLAASTSADLRAEIERVHGDGFLARKDRDVEREIRTLTFSPPSSVRVVEGTIPEREEGFAARYEKLATASVALDVLLHARRPAPEAYRVVDDPSYRLTEAELGTLAARASQLRSSLLRLATSRRQDWGYPMLVGMARLVALDASLRSGRLVVPDSFDTAAASVPVERLLADTRVAPALVDERRAELAAARAELFSTSPSSEAVWSRFELAANAMLELDDAVRRGEGSVREYPETMLPSRSSELDPSLPVPIVDCHTLAGWKRTANDAVESLRERLREVYHYDVVSRNCVTEIFRTIDAAGAAFGPHERADTGLGFLPFVSADEVNARYPVSERSTLPSYRTYWLGRLRESEGRARTALRESNTITATLRHPDDRDDVFLFYTDDVGLLRPLYGAINAGVGAGASVAGLATLPFDRGRLLFTGVRSFVFSLPEIAFVNLRKGKNGILPRAWM